MPEPQHGCLHDPSLPEACDIPYQYTPDVCIILSSPLEQARHTSLAPGTIVPDPPTLPAPASSPAVVPVEHKSRSSHAPCFAAVSDSSHLASAYYANDRPASAPLHVDPPPSPASSCAPSQT